MKTNTSHMHEKPISPRTKPLPSWISLLGVTEKGGRDYTPMVEGEIPKALRGSLFRNGPGIFERGEKRLSHLLDGDGLIQRLSFSDQGVRYQNSFVKTRKYLEEEKKQQRRFSTWTTRKSGNPIANLGGGITQSQAGVTVYPVFDKIVARDEIGPSFIIDPETLDTLDEMAPACERAGVLFKAHSKMDPHTGEWLTVGLRSRKEMRLYVTVYGPSFKVKRQFDFASPRNIYFHDFFATENHILFVLHPCFFNPLPFLAGLRSYTDCLSWRGGEGNILAVVKRTGGEARFFEAPGAYMWHALNAYEEKGEIIADFVAFERPDHFIGPDAFMRTIMRGEQGNAQEAGKIRRYRLSMASQKLREEIIDEKNHEFPMIDPRVMTRHHRKGYFVFANEGAIHCGVRSYDYQKGLADTYDFGENIHVGEPVFAAPPEAPIDDGWLLTQCLDAEKERSFFALFNANAIAAGPVAKIWLEHHLPISFHGAWQNQ